MRIVAFAACSLFLALSGPASAADCTRGMLWPYVRNTGDCLTDQEIKAGQTGVYQGALNTNPDLSAIPRDAPQQTGAIGGGATTTDNGALINTGIFSDGHPTRVNTAPACNKGTFWPFVRSDGDCPTEVERKDGKTVYGNPVAVTPASAATVAATGTRTPNTPEADAGGATTVEPACHKGTFWPFVREPGDCPTDAEKKAQAAKK